MSFTPPSSIWYTFIRTVITAAELHTSGILATNNSASNTIITTCNVSKSDSCELNQSPTSGSITTIPEIDANNKQNESHLEFMQTEVLNEVDQLKKEVSDGRKLIIEESRRLGKIRQESYS